MSSTGEPRVEALGLNGVSKCTAAKRGCPTFVFRWRAGLDAEGWDAIGPLTRFVGEWLKGDVFWTWSV